MITRAESWVTVSRTWLAKKIKASSMIANSSPKKQRDERELDRGRAAAVTAKPAQDISSGAAGEDIEETSGRGRLQQRIT
jgi:hypothetical protein